MGSSWSGPACDRSESTGALAAFCVGRKREHNFPDDLLLCDDGNDDEFRHGGPVVTERREPLFQESPFLDIQETIAAYVALRKQGAVDV